MPETLTEEGQLRKMANDIAAWNIELLAKPTNSGHISFEAQRNFFGQIKNFYDQIANSHIPAIPQAKIAGMLRQGAEIIECLRAIQNFDVRSVSDPRSASNESISRLHQTWNPAYSQMAVDVAIARISSPGFKQELSNARAEIESIKHSWAATKKGFEQQQLEHERQLKEKRDEMEKLLTAARNAVRLDVVSAQASEFNMEATRCAKTAVKWLWATVAMVILSTGIAWKVLLSSFTTTPVNVVVHQSVALATNQPVKIGPNQATANRPGGNDSQSPRPDVTQLDAAATTAAVIQQSVARIFIVTLLYGLVIWCARNYFACRHNYTVNRHRRNAMQTFRAFVEGTKDTPTQDFILRQAAACAFSPQQSGYLKDESLPSPAPSAQILDMFGGKGDSAKT